MKALNDVSRQDILDIQLKKLYQYHLGIFLGDEPLALLHCRIAEVFLLSLDVLVYGERPDSNYLVPLDRR